MAQNSFALMTNLGRAKEAAALANGTAIVITHIAIGDGTTVPSGGETALYHEVARKAISGHGTVAGASNVAYFDIFLAAAEGPYTIREAGLYDDAGDLIAIARYDPPINKPVPASGQTVEGTVRLEVAFSNIASVTIIVDPAFTVPLQRLSRLPWIAVLSMSVTAPPASANLGDAYLVPTGATAAWAGQSGKIAEYTAAGWAIITPPDGHGVSLPDGRVFEKIGGVYVEKLALDAQAGKWNYAVAGGSANALTATLVPAPSAYVAGIEANIKIGSANTGAVTLNLNGLGVKQVVRVTGDALTAGDLLAGQVRKFVYDGTRFQLVANSKSGPEKFAIFATPGSDTFTVPTGVTQIRVKVWGGGGGGGGGAGTANIAYAGSGGGGGGFADGIFSVTPGQVLPITVGGGGTGGPALSPGTAGETSSVSSLISATGGGGGKYQPATNTVNTSGGIGAGGYASRGGSGGIVIRDGGTGNALGGAGGAGGGYGGQGGVQSSATAGNGVSPAGGGGGGGGPGNMAGGAGAAGLVIIEY